MKQSLDLCRLAWRGIAVVSLLHAAVPAAAVEIPFSTALQVDPTFAGATSVELADLDGDGDLDAVGTAATDGHLTWWRNTAGDGSSWTQLTVDLAFAGAASVQVADVDADGWPDLVAAARTDGEVSWYRNSGTPPTITWTHFLIDSAFAGARSVWVADLDRNGTLDVVAAGDTADEVAWWQNDGTPTDDTTDDGMGNYWTHRTIGGGAPVSVAAADLDGDGHLDVLAAGTALGWYQNDGDPTDGGWALRNVDSAFPGLRAVSFADLDGDGDLDVLGAATDTTDTVAWWENDGDPTDNVNDGSGNFWPQHTVADAFDGAFSVRAVDLDRDGDLDLLAAAATADDVTWWENDGTPGNDTTDLGGGNFWAVHTVDASFNGALAAAAGDVDGDGDLDVAAASFGDGLVSWWRNESIHGSALFSTEGQIGTGQAPEALALGDLDGDGDLDVVSGFHESPPEITWLENDGTPGDGGWAEHLVGNPTLAGPLEAAVGDLDGDGDADVVAGYFSDGLAFGWWENDGSPATGTWTEHELKASASSVREIELADLDHDGDLDVVFVESFADLVGWFENDGSACSPDCAWPEHTIDGAFGLASHLAVADFDRDGDLDVAGKSATDQLLVWWENDGTPAGDPSWAEHGIDSGNGELCPVTAADVDGDGDLDVVSCQGTPGTLGWFENDGTPGDDTSWTLQSTIVPGPGSPDGVAVLDLDRDGDLDVATSVGQKSSSDDEYFAWWENTAGDGSTWSRHDVESPVLDFLLLPGDLDGDGRPDLVGAKTASDTVAWWPNGGGQFALATTDLSSGGILDGTSDDLLAIVASHRGRTGDRDVELETFELLLEESAGDPLSTAEANALIANLEIYLDDGSGTFDGADVQVAAASPLALTAGVQTVFMSGSDVQIELGVPRTYLVVVTTKASASAQTPNTFRVTHVTSASSTARDAVDLYPLELERADDVSTAQITAQGGCFALTLGHTGGGTDPAPTPAQSAGCGAGEYVPGEVVSLQATPDAGWQVGGWTGTDDDGSTATANAVTMPASAHAASVDYVFPDELVIDGDFLGGTQVKEACLVIRAGDVPAVEPAGASTTVAASADVTFRAGESVVFYDGFQVLSNATLVVEIATPTACLP